MTGSSKFQKKLQRLDQPTLVIFFAFLKKNTTTGSSLFLSPDGQGSYHCIKYQLECLGIMIVENISFEVVIRL